MHCPYCDSKFPNSELHTHAQTEYLQAAAKEKALEYAHAEINKMLGDLAKNFKGNKFVQLKHTPVQYLAKTVLPTYSEPEVDTELCCPECGFRFQVFGIFGFCPGCSTENMLIYDANISIIRAEISSASDKNRALRHAYGDLVSSFEHFCLSKAGSNIDDKTSFQDIFEARRFFKKDKGLDILDSLAPEESLCIRRVFQKRHAYQHSAGEITDKYVKKIPEDAALLERQAELSEVEFEDGARVLRTILGNLAGGRLNA